MAKKKQIQVENTVIQWRIVDQEDYISLTDMVRDRENPSIMIINWLRNKDTLLFLGVWEKLNNPNFNLIEFDKITNQAGTNAFIISAKRWIQETQAVGIISKQERYLRLTQSARDQLEVFYRDGRELK